MTLVGAAQAQKAERPVTTMAVMDGKLVDRLPVDRLDQLLGLLPGITVTGRGSISIRGGIPRSEVTSLDGVSISPGYRKTDFTQPPTGFPGLGQSFFQLGTNAVSSLSVISGPLPARLGNTQTGVIALETRSGGERLEAGGAFETDALSGQRHGPGVDRLQGSVGGRLGSAFHFAVAGAVQGQESLDRGPGADNAPLFTPAGTDTVVGIPSSFGDPFADTTFVTVTSFAPSDGIRVSSSGSSFYQLAGKLEYDLGPRTKLWLSGGASRDQLRIFDPQLLSLPSNLQAVKGTNRVLTLGLHHETGFQGSPLLLGAALSFQRDQSVRGPLTQESEQDTRGAFLFTGFDFTYDMESFPVDDELIANIRNNIPGSRRTPLDLENTSQYTLINRFRNSAYGLDGGPEAGGPSGRLSLLKESRTTGTFSATWRPGSHAMTAGLEFTRYSLASYDHFFTSQAYSDAFLARPTRMGLYLEDEVRVSDFVIRAGVRYDRFNSDGERPFVLDTVATSSFFGTYSYFPAPSSYGTGGITFNGDPLMKYVPDDAHDVVSPRLQVAFAAGAGTTVRAGFARQVQMPDLAFVLSGMNTDLRVTNTNHPYGADLDFERTTIYEGGINHRISRGLIIDAAVYDRELDDQVVLDLITLRDPARLGEDVDIFQLSNLGLGSVIGVDTRLEIRRGMLLGLAGYSYQKTEQSLRLLAQATDVPLADSRPHTLNGALGLETPSGWREGSLTGTIFQDLGVYAAFRYSSGTAYTRCQPGGVDESVLSGMRCLGGPAGQVNDTRLPSFKQLDLRVTRGFRLAGHEVIAYLDGRNILNFENVLAVFATTGKVANPVSQAQAFFLDSLGFAAEGQVNGLLQADGSIDLRFGGALASGCGNYVNTQFSPAAPSCVYLIRAEERFGDGDHIFSVEEQREASEAHYATLLGRSNLLAPPRRIRLGLELRF